MNYYKEHPLAINWLTIKSNEKRQIIKQMDQSDIEAIKEFKEVFNATVLELELHESVD